MTNESVPSELPTHAPLHRTPLSTHGLDRAHDRRSEAEWLNTNRGRTGVVHVVWQGSVAVVANSDSPPGAGGGSTHRSAVFNASAAPEAEQHVLLGELNGTHHWAVDLSHLDRASVDSMLAAEHGETVALLGMREAAAGLGADEGNLLAFAAGMGYWHRTHQLCGSCGQPTASATAGHERVCSGCGQTHWPRTDPAVIMLTVDTANDRALLGRQKVWPARMYSTLAGFVEPGESLEDAVARETWEEAGVRIGEVRYFCSQPWPFPRSVMLGFHARYASGEPTPHPTEMDDVRWFAREELEASRDAARLGVRPDPMIPPPLTISRALIDAWLDGRTAL